VSAGAEPFVGEPTDEEALTKAFIGAQAVYVMMPPNLTSQDYRSYQDQVTEAVATAIEKNRVKYAVSLSSIGADKTEKTGPILGLRRLEERLNQISGLNVLHLRAAYFMENTLAQASIIPSLGAAVGPLRPELKIPMIATRDIGEFAANVLLGVEFAGQQVQELHGQRDLSYSDVTAIIGKAIGKPDLKYRQLAGEQFRGALMQMGMSESIAGLIVEMSTALDSGHCRPLEARSPRNTTPTSYETFVAEEFLPVYRKNPAAA
jgi:uncharacterized protein YbjT (DUF2867 family)